jgi:hypothetical protein
MEGLLRKTAGATLDHTRNAARRLRLANRSRGTTGRGWNDGGYDIQCQDPIHEDPSTLTIADVPQNEQGELA